MRFSLAAELPLSFLAFCLVVSSTLAAPGVQRRRSDGLHIPLQRRATPSRTSDEWAEWAQREKYRLDAKYGTPSRKRSSGYNLLVNQDADSSYYGSLAVGTPAVAYNVILDTGSADFWLADSTCSSGCSSDLTTFDSSRSSSFSNTSATFSVTYGSGSVSGNLATDVVQMAGFQVTEQTFGLADQISSGLIDSPVSGLMGLAWQGLSSFSAKPFWQQLYESNVLDSGVMGFFLTRYINVSSAQTLESGGVFTLGATNTSLYTGEIDYRPLSQDNLYWTIPLSNITIGSSTVTMSSDTSAAVIDTGTTLIGGPSSEVAEVYRQISGSSALSGNYDGYYSYPCSTDVSISLSFGGRTWTIASDDFSLFQIDSDTCVGAIFVFSSSSTDPASPFSGSGSSSTISWIFGDTFLKNVYSVFRASPASVGFAQLSDAAIAINGDSSATVPTPTTGSVSASVTGNTKLNGAARPMMGVALFISSLAIQLLFFV